MCIPYTGLYGVVHLTCEPLKRKLIHWVAYYNQLEILEWMLSSSQVEDDNQSVEEDDAQVEEDDAQVEEDDQ
jgi:hypothetical protein